MFFLHRKYYYSLQQAIRYTICHHDTKALNTLIENHGINAFSKAISTLSGRIIADALAMLAITERKLVINKLSHAARKKLESIDHNVLSILLLTA